MPDEQTTLVAAAIKRCSDIENKIAYQPSPRDYLDRIVRAQLLREKRRRFCHARDLFWHLARQAGLDPDWAKKENARA